VLDGLLTREWDAAWTSLKHLILPALALASIPFAVVFRITRGAVLDVLDEDYVRTAYAKGLTDRVIRGRHVLCDAMLPVVTTIGLQTGALLSGAVLTERVFAYQGVGQALAIGFERRDYAVLQVVIVAAAMVYVLVNLVVGLSYAAIEGRGHHRRLPAQGRGADHGGRWSELRRRTGADRRAGRGVRLRQVRDRACDHEIVAATGRAGQRLGSVRAPSCSGSPTPRCATVAVATSRWCSRTRCPRSTPSSRSGCRSPRCWNATAACPASGR